MHYEVCCEHGTAPTVFMNDYWISALVLGVHNYMDIDSLSRHSPGVPVTMSMSLDSSLACLLMGSPPRIVMLQMVGSVRRLCRLAITAPVCSAKSLLGSRMIAVGERLSWPEAAAGACVSARDQNDWALVPSTFWASPIRLACLDMVISDECRGFHAPKCGEKLFC